MKFVTDYTLENYILNAQWEDFPEDVRKRAVVCFMDLLAALVIGSRSKQFRVGVKLARWLYRDGRIPVVGCDEKFSFMGAATAMGHASNAFDIDDGHNMIRAHPGTSFIGGLIAMGYEKEVSYQEFLTALVVSYEATIRMGLAIIEHYHYYHGSGTFGAFGTAAGVGRLYGLNREQLNNALSVAEFHAPLTPAPNRSVGYPSMNKDGVPFGVMIGAMAVMETLAGFTGKKHLLELPENRHYLDSLGTSYEILNLYFKPYACCRWAHPAIEACLSIMRENNVKASDIEKITLKTFKFATLLSKMAPEQTDDAQYNIAYPVASAIVHGDFGFEQAIEENLGDKRVLDILDRLSFKIDEEMEKVFPGRRICRAEVLLKNGKNFISKDREPKGEAVENIGIDDIREKFYRVTRPLLTRKAQDKTLAQITGNLDCPFRNLIDDMNAAENWKAMG